MEMKITQMIDAMFDKSFKLKEKQKADPGFMVAECKKIEKLFDIAKCDCYRGCQNMEEAQQVMCQCQPSHKTPEKEIPYYLDQKSERKLYISSVDLTAAKGVREREQQKITQEERAGKKEFRMKLTGAKAPLSQRAAIHLIQVINQIFFNLTTQRK